MEQTVWKPLTKTENNLYNLLSRLATKKKRQACISKKVLAQQLGVSQSTIQKSIKTLEEKGMVRVEQRYEPEVHQRLSNRYTVLDSTYYAKRK